ncbi:MAG: TetR/AcrR family transcriptional regulator [Deltaproteobacteria bacterium]|jgi:AcrR family transcriptional regulator|nr:TetR/AcrR family transcriptional regulator [Deltaproteobacteria bacterium]MCW8893573.1 TetR/AcrR family transcriptional regulator [Deltaproteobacteria bacterium]MCW9050474.1 TetR/AcrR family transcriptional regulator [Deltaproteobacteria bacterium]
MLPVKKTKQKIIMQAALELFAEQGFHDAPMSQLAEQAQVGVGSVYRYFKDKNELIEKLYFEVDEALQMAIIKNVDQTLSTRQQFLQLITNLIHFLRDHPHEFKFLEQYYHSPFGIDKKREKLLLENGANQKNPFMQLFFSDKTKAVKTLPGPVLHALAFGPVLFLLRDAMAGLVELDDALIEHMAKGCWDAIRISTAGPAQ